MTVVVVGVIADTFGAAAQWETAAANTRGRSFDVRRVYSSVPSVEYRSVQPAAIAVDVDHDRVIGAVKYLERTDSKLYCVAEVDGAGLGQGPWFYSPYIRHYDGKEIELRGLALTRSPASIGLGAIDAIPGNLNEAARSVVYQDGFAGAIVKRANEYDRRRHNEPIVIQGVHPQKPTQTLERASTGQRVEIRSATAVDVHRARRELDLLIAPAEQPTMIHEPGRQYTEVFSHGAFAGVEADPSKIRVNRDHVRERVIGKALRLDPWHETGLTGTVKLARTAASDEALALIADDLLGVSAGFAVDRSGVEWRGHSHRRIRRALLDHVALVPEPAYQGAAVTAVRANSKEHAWAHSLT